MTESVRLYVGTQTGLQVFRYRARWVESLGEHFPNHTVEALIGCRRRPHMLYAGVAFDGAYRTQDGGQHWQKVLEGDVRAIAVDPADESIVYAGAGPIRLWRSYDAGASWEPLDSLLQLPPEVQVKWRAPLRLQNIQPAHVRHIFIHPEDSNILLVCLEHGGVVRSLDGGATWEDVSEGIVYPDMHQIGSLPGSKERYFVSSARGFFFAQDTAKGWSRQEDGMPWAYTEAQSYSHDWLFFPSTPRRMLLAGSNGSPGFWGGRPTGPEGVILRSDDGGQHWRQVCGGLPERMPWMAWALALHPTDPGTVFAGMGDQSRGFGFTPGKAGSGAFYVTRDYGDSWEPVIPAMPSVCVAWAALE